MPAVADVSSAAPAAADVQARRRSRVPPSAAPRDTLVVHGTGDVNLDPDYIPALRSNGWAHAWSGLDGLFAADDLTVVNLECPVSTGGTIVPKEFNFRCDPAALPAARAAGVEVVNLANNHSGDYGPQAMLDSVIHARAAGLAPVGVGANVTAAPRRRSSSGTAGGSRCSASAASSPRPAGWPARTAPAWPTATTSSP